MSKGRKPHGLLKASPIDELTLSILEKPGVVDVVHTVGFVLTLVELTGIAVLAGTVTCIVAVLPSESVTK